MSNKETENCTEIKYWIQSTRPLTLTGTAMPVLLSAALVPYYGLAAKWWLLPLIFISAVGLQAATNMVSDYFDLKKGVDRLDTFGSSRVLVEGHIEPHKVLLGGFVIYALSAAIGLVFIWVYGWPILVLGLIGMLSGFFYTGYPIGYKYFGLGDLGVFVMLGPLMVIGSFYVLTGTFRYDVLLISLKIGFLITAVLTANNMRDIKHDTEAGIRSTAMVLGLKVTRIEYILLLVGAYVASLALIALKVLPVWSLIVLITVPLAVKNIKKALTSDVDHPENVATLDMETAQLHLPFSMLLIISILLGAFL